jgi:ferredoxin-NADP reductase
MRCAALLRKTAGDDPRNKILVLDVPGWEGHKVGQHVDVKLTAEDGYQAQRSYSIASAPEDERLTVDRLDEGEGSSALGRKIGAAMTG